MTYSSDLHTGDGVATDFSVSFPYLDQSHVKVRVDKVFTTEVGANYKFEWVASNSIRVTTVVDSNPVPASLEIEFIRETPINDPAVVFGGGVSLSSANLNKNSEYLTYALQEATDANEEFTKLYLGAFSSAPSSDNDGEALQVGAVFYNTTASALYYWTGSVWIIGESTIAAEAARDAALLAQAAAELAETNAGTSETNAGTSETNAAASAAAAAASATAAGTSETNADADAVAAAASAAAASTSETNAAASATAASTSETNADADAVAAAASAATATTKAGEASSSAAAAALSETNAGTSETNAATSETNAAASAAAAATFDPDGFVKIGAVSAIGYAWVKRNDAVSPPLLLTQQGVGDIARFCSGADVVQSTISNDGALQLKGTTGHLLKDSAGNSLFEVTESGGSVSMGGIGPTTIVGSGGSAALIKANVTLTSDGTYIGSDDDIQLFTDLDSGWGSHHTFQFTAGGIIKCDGNTVDHAGRNAGVAGGYAFLCPAMSGTAYSHNDIVSGSLLDYSAATAKSTASPPGTWKCMGYSNGGTTASNRVTLWKRIS